MLVEVTCDCNSSSVFSNLNCTKPRGLLINHQISQPPTENIDSLSSHTHSLFGACDCAELNRGVFMTLTMMVTVDVEIKKKTINILFYNFKKSFYFVLE